LVKDSGSNFNKLLDILKRSKFNWTALVILIVISVVIGLLNDAFFSVENLLNILRQVSVIGIVSVGMTFVIISGGFDLSVGHTAAAAGAFASWFVVYDRFPVPVAVAAGLTLGLILGLINGYLISYQKFPPFIATLGMGTVIRGATYVFTNGYDVIHLSDDFTKIGGNKILTIPVPIYLFIGIIIIGIIVLNFTKFGRYIYAIGGNEKVAVMVGLRVNLVKTLTYAISGLLAAFAGIILASRLQAGLPMAGQGYELQAITAAVIGGTSLSGGIGGIGGTVVGTLILGVMSNGFDLMLAPYYYKQIAIGAVMLLTVVVFGINELRRREKRI
jgi:ribose/xylose/arabinose/galactoside ABC-type transport system permease subunit